MQIPDLFLNSVRGYAIFKTLASMSNDALLYFNIFIAFLSFSLLASFSYFSMMLSNSEKFIAFIIQTEFTQQNSLVSALIMSFLPDI